MSDSVALHLSAAIYNDVVDENSHKAFTIGYAQRTLDDLVELLRAVGVTRVIDVRALPLSRRRGFSKTALARGLADGGIEYVHVRAAGNPFRHEAAGIDRCLERYRGYLREAPYVVAEVERAMDGRTVALLCAEADALRCHRSVLADWIGARRPNLIFHHL